MILTLRVLRCPDAVPPETRRVTGGEFRIGRGPDNDWVMPDPERMLSKRHCVIAFRNGGWAIADTSTNGTFLNRDAEALGPGQIRGLNDGDRICFGAYEIEVRLEQAHVQHVAPSAFGASPAFGSQAFGNTDDVFAPKQGAPGTFSSSAFGSNPFLPGGMASPPKAMHQPLLPDDDWVLGFPSAPLATPMLRQQAEPLNPFTEELRVAAAQSVSPHVMPSASPPVAPAPLNVAVPQAEPNAVAELWAAFLEGAGTDGPVPQDLTATMRNIGAAFRATVSGIRQALIARAAIKGEFRIEQTMIRSRGNNPLKFSSDDEDALNALLGLGRRTNITPETALADALRDMRLHELATVAAMQDAVRALLAQLEPAKLRAEADQGGMALLPAQKKARAFEAYEKLHDYVTRALADDFDSVFGKSFARAYEVALRDINAKEPS